MTDSNGASDVCEHLNRLEPWENIETLSFRMPSIERPGVTVIRIDEPYTEPVMYTQSEECVDCGHVFGVSMDTETVVTTDERLIKAMWHTVQDEAKARAAPASSDAAVPDARKCPHPDGLFVNEHDWDEEDIACEACGQAMFYLDMFSESATTGQEPENYKPHVSVDDGGSILVELRISLTRRIAIEVEPGGQFEYVYVTGDKAEGGPDA